MRRLDPRTHLFVMILASVLVILAPENFQADLLVALSAIYLLCNGLPKKILQYGFIYIGLKLIVSVLPHDMGTHIIIIYTIAKMIPVMMIASVLLHVSPSALLCAFEKIRIPKSVLVMICVLIRFFPVLVLEMKTIRDGIRARGIFPRRYNTLLHPAMAYECFFVPLMVRCLKLSSELSTSAELRGIECDCKRTTTHPVGLRAIDFLAICCYLLAGGGIYWAGVLAG